jgi:ketosteroid isomerase-like protein
MDKRVSKIKQAFNEFNGRNAQVLSLLYDEGVIFQDPVQEVKGLKNLEKYYQHAYKNVKSIKFDFKDFVLQEEKLVATWVMQAEVNGLNRGKAIQVDGVSLFFFNKEDKVVYHRDYLDLGQMVYENIWGLGLLVKKIKTLLQIRQQSTSSAEGKTL